MDFDLYSARKRLSYLPRGLLAHCQRTSQLCVELAHHWGWPEDRAAWAGLVHDLARAYPEGELLYLAREYSLQIDPMEETTPVLLHGPVGAEILRRKWQVTDGAVLEAVRWHTSGNRDMGPLAKIVFLADKIEPGKSGLYPHLAPIRDLVKKDVDRALLEFFNSQISFLQLKHFRVHPAMIAAGNYFRLRLASQ